MLVLQHRVFGDDRGRFFEAYSQPKLAEAGITQTFVQDNVSVSQRRVLRGLHYQLPNAQGKLVTVLRGRVWDVAVDIRQGSPTFKQHYARELTAENAESMWVPAGFAHGFLALEDDAVFHYKVTALYSPQDDRNLRFDDPDLGIEWPLDEPVLSKKDEAAPLISEVDPSRLPTFSP